MYENPRSDNETFKRMLVKGLTDNHNMRLSVARILVDDVVDNKNDKNPNAELVALEFARIWNDVFQPVFDALSPLIEEDED